MSRPPYRTHARCTHVFWGGGVLLLLLAGCMPASAAGLRGMAAEMDAQGTATAQGQAREAQATQTARVEATAQQATAIVRDAQLTVAQATAQAAQQTAYVGGLQTTGTVRSLQIALTAIPANATATAQARAERARDDRRRTELGLWLTFGFGLACVLALLAMLFRVTRRELDHLRADRKAVALLTAHVLWDVTDQEAKHGRNSTGI